MGFTLQILHRSTGEQGPPTGANSIGELAINFAVPINDPPELWINDGTAWVRVNPDLDVEMAYIILPGGTAGDKTGIGNAWDTFTPKPTEPFVIATYGVVPYLKTGNALLDSGWDYLVDPTVAQTATTEAQAAAAAAAISAVTAGNSATAAGISETNSGVFASDSEDSAIAAQAAADTIPAPATGTEGQLLAINSAVDAYELIDPPLNQVSSVVGTTDQINVDSTDPVNPVISISPNFRNQLPRVSDILTGNVQGLGFSYRNEDSINFEKGNCYDSLGSTILTLAVDSTAQIPGIAANGVYSAFLTDAGDIQFDTDAGGTTLLGGAVSLLRWIGYAHANAVGEIAYFVYNNGQIIFSKASDNVLASISVTTIGTAVTVDHSILMPDSRIAAIQYGVSTASASNAHINSTLDGVNGEFVINRAANVHGDTDQWAWGNSITHPIAPFTSSRKFWRTDNNANLLAHMVTLKR